MGNTFKKSNIASDARRGARKALGVAAALALLGGSVAALADPPVTMAPPVDGGGGYQPSDNQSYDNGPAYDNAGNDAQVTNVADATRDTVFNWQEVPQGQQVPVRRAVFDQGGYQIYDSVGETIVVPFTDHNLYAMKFAVSPDGSTYFENTGADPILYVPRGGFLENAAVPGARWYPFSENFHPATPVFLGIAPSWDDYCAMGWYPHMAFYGGYWGRRPYYEGASLSLFTASFGLSIFLGGRHYDGWAPYHRFYEGHPAPYHVTVVNNDYYRFGGHPDFNRGGGFRGGHPDFAGRGLGGDHNFGGGHGVNGGQRVFNGGQGVGGPHDFARERNVGGGRVFNGGGQTVYAHRNIPGDRSFGGIRPAGANAGHTFGSNTNRTFGGGHTFQGAGPSPAGRTFGGGQNSGGDRGFGGNSGGHPFGATRPMPGVEARPASHGGHSFGGGRPAGAQPASHGGDRSAARPSTDNGGHGGGNHDGGNRGGDHGDRR